MTITLARLSASTEISARDIQRLTDAIDRIMPFVLVAEGFRDRSIIADDAEIEGKLFSPEAFAAIRGGSVGAVPVGLNTIAIDGRKIRAFLPAWAEIVSVLGLSGPDKVRPVDEVTARDAADSIARLSLARAALVELIPEGAPKKKSRRALVAFMLLGAGAVYINRKRA